MPNSIYHYGHWPSPISAELVSAQGTRISEPQACANRLFYLETRPQEQGRTALVYEEAGERRDILPAPHSVRTRMHEYGGGAYKAIATGVFCVLDEDQQIYWYDFAEELLLRLTTPDPGVVCSRYADFFYDHRRHVLLAIRERDLPTPGQPRSEIISIDLSSHHITVLAEGADFYSNPRLSPDGNRLSYLRWNHPQMPWDGTYCICAELNTEGQILEEQVVAGGESESISQPQWSPEGKLFFVSDRTNWWNIYCWDGDAVEAVCPMSAEFATPQWLFGMSNYGFLTSDQLLCSYTQQGQWRLGIISLASQALKEIPTDFCDISAIHCVDGAGHFIAASTTRSSQLWCYRNDALAALGDSAPPVHEDFIAKPQALSFCTTDNDIAHGFFYPPTNPTVEIPPLSLPPLIIMCHGGPTGATQNSLNLKIQFWTSRGFAVFDINYRGSTGFGRTYRDRLKHNWGITDVIDVCSGASFLASEGLVDPHKMAIRGSSAGGYTVLAALTFSQIFKAGASLYGVGDLEALARDTHKFESHYLESLVAPYPAKKAIYHQRSPIHHIDQLKCPVIFLQGLEDRVVPPAQAEALFNALQHKGIPTEYVTFPEEGHGFRQAHNIQRAFNAELAFYLRIFSGGGVI